MFFFNWAEFFLLSSSCLSSAPLVFHHQSSHITTLLVNIFAYNHRHRRIIKYILSLPANLLKFVGETFEFHGGEARIQNHLQGLPNTFQISSTNDYKYIMKKWEISSIQGLWFMKGWTFRQDRGYDRITAEHSIAIIWFCSMFTSDPSPIIVYPHQWWLTPPLLLLRLEWCDSVWWW